MMYGGTHGFCFQDNMCLSTKSGNANRLNTGVGRIPKFDSESRGGRMLLLADDEALIGLLVRPHLEKAGFQTVFADNGARAVELAIRNVPELIILDIVMPEMDGLAVLRLLKWSESTRLVPVIIVSATYDHVIHEEAKKCGAAGFLTKPFSPAQLLAEIRRVMGGAALGGR